MLKRRSLRLPITLAVVMLALLTTLAVGWVLLNVFPAIKGGRFAPLYWTLLALGSTFILLLLLGVVLYLILTVKAINLNRRQSNFIDSVTHELKSPLASMKLYLQTLHRRQVSQEEQAEFYRSMLEDLDRLDRLIDQLLDAARLESDRTDGEAEDVLLPQLLQDWRGPSVSAIACRRRRSTSPCSLAWSARGGSIWTSSFATSSTTR